MHLQSYFSLQNKLDLRHTTNLISKLGKESQAHRWNYSIPKKGPSPGLLCHKRVTPKAPVSLGNTSSPFKVQPKSITHCKIHQGKACNLQKMHVRNIQKSKNRQNATVSTPMCTSYPIPLHMKKEKA